MRSKEVADFAGVTVRALRHYHAIGLLPEPSRSANGYRDYGAMDVARVLRIKRMASLGLPLEKIAAMLGEEAESDAASSADGALAALDAELAAQIARLEEQRRIIRDLREGDVSADTPQLFAEHMARLRDAGASERMLQAERDILLIAEEGVGERAEILDDLTRFYEFVAERGAMEAYVALNDAVFSMPADAPESQRERVVREAVNLFVPLYKRFVEESGPLTDEEFPSMERVEQLVKTYDDENLNAAQRDVSKRIEAAFLKAVGEGE